MFATRRSWLKNFATFYGSLAFFQGCPPIPTPRVRTPTQPPPPEDKQDADTSNTNPAMVQRRTQEKEFRDTASELFARVRDLVADLDHTPTTSVFSVAIFKRTQEIEKLAKRLKGYARS
jgi:hypothetical protein